MVKSELKKTITLHNSNILQARYEIQLLCDKKF